VWGIGFDGSDRVVDNHIKKLRKNLGKPGEAIKTVIGGGYKIV
jgi:DNA-binding response OmpR family regulator